MKMDMLRPCDQCPFRTDIAPYLRPGSVRAMAERLTVGQQTFSCHKTLDLEACSAEEEFAEEHGQEVQHTTAPDEQHCAGALILLEKLGQPNQLMRIFERFGGYDRRKLDMKAPVFDSFQAMARAQRGFTPKQKKPAAEVRADRVRAGKAPRKKR